MTDYKELYLTMFRSAERARKLLTKEPFTRSNAQKAVLILELAQAKCEKLYVEDGGK